MTIFTLPVINEYRITFCSVHLTRAVSKQFFIIAENTQRRVVDTILLPFQNRRSFVRRFCSKLKVGSSTWNCKACRATAFLSVYFFIPTPPNTIIAASIIATAIFLFPINVSHHLDHLQPTSQNSSCQPLFSGNPKPPSLPLLSQRPIFQQGHRRNRLHPAAPRRSIPVPKR